MYVDIFLSVVT